MKPPSLTALPQPEAPSASRSWVPQGTWGCGVLQWDSMHPQWLATLRCREVRTV